MNQDIHDNEGFKTRLDASGNKLSETRRDAFKRRHSNAKPRPTRHEYSDSETSDRNTFVPSTSVESDGSEAYHRVRLPLQLESAYKSVEELPTKGAEADLLVIQEKVTGRKYILKLYRRDIVPKREIAEKIKSVSIRHPEYFIRLIQYSYSSQLSYEILEYLEEGSLSNFISTNKEISEHKSYRILQQLSNALDILHQNDIVHRDLKPGNVLIRQQEPLKLALIDFGISSVLDDATRRITSLNATTRYASPEALLAGEISTSSDFWSLGIIMVEILTGKHPFSGLSEQVVKSEISQRSIDVSSVQNIRWRELCQGLLLRDSHKRWGNTEVSQWLEGKDPTLEVDNYYSESTATRPYILRKESYYTPQALAVAIANHWDDGIKRLLRGNIREWIKESLQDDDLYNDIRDIEEGITDDSDLKILLAISKLNPNFEPTYREHSLTEEGLLVIADSENADIIRWLYYSGALRIYGEHAQKTKYIEIDRSWRSSIVEFAKLLDQVKASQNVANSLVSLEQNSLASQAFLLKYSVSKKQKSKLIQIVQGVVSLEAQKCKWFNAIVPENLEDASVASLYVVLLTAPIAKRVIEIKYEREVSSYLEVVRTIKKSIDSISLKDESIYQSLFSDLPFDRVDKLLTTSATESSISFAEHQEKLNAIIEEISLIYENASAFLKTFVVEKKEELDIKIRESDMKIASVEHRIQRLRKAAYKERESPGSHESRLKELRRDLALTGYYKRKKSGLNASHSSRMLMAEIVSPALILVISIACIVLIFLAMIKVTTFLISSALFASLCSVILFVSKKHSIKLFFRSQKEESLLHEIDSLSSMVNSKKVTNSLQENIVVLEKELTEIHRGRNAYKKEAKGLASTFNDTRDFLRNPPKWYIPHRDY